MEWKSSNWSPEWSGNEWVYNKKLVKIDKKWVILVTGFGSQIRWEANRLKFWWHKWWKTNDEKAKNWWMEWKFNKKWESEWEVKSGVRLDHCWILTKSDHNSHFQFVFLDALAKLLALILREWMDNELKIDCHRFVFCILSVYHVHEQTLVLSCIFWIYMLSVTPRTKSSPKPTLNYCTFHRDWGERGVLLSIDYISQLFLLL